LSAVLAYLASAQRILLLTAYLAVSLGWLSVTYLCNRPALFAKRADGTLPLRTRAALFPYLGLQEIVYRLSRGFSLPVSQIARGLFLGPRLLASEEAILAQLNITGVLDLTCEFSEPAAIRKGREYLCLPVLDGLAPRRNQLEAAMAFLSRHVRVYVHCAQGHGRSATIVAARLVILGECPYLAAALSRIQILRPKARLNRAQIEALSVFLGEMNPRQGGA
jgi:predicted protein tyrosine phosphatase